MPSVHPESCTAWPASVLDTACLCIQAYLLPSLLGSPCLFCSVQAHMGLGTNSWAGHVRLEASSHFTTQVQLRSNNRLPDGSLSAEAKMSAFTTINAKSCSYLRLGVQNKSYLFLLCPWSCTHLEHVFGRASQSSVGKCAWTLAALTRRHSVHVDAP